MIKILEVSWRTLELNSPDGLGGQTERKFYFYSILKRREDSGHMPTVGFSEKTVDICWLLISSLRVKISVKWVRSWMLKSIYIFFLFFLFIHVYSFVVSCRAAHEIIFTLYFSTMCRSGNSISISRIYRLSIRFSLLRTQQQQQQQHESIILMMFSHSECVEIFFVNKKV